MHVVLVEPEIPSNTGNIVRTCVATGTSLHLVGPLGFSLRDKYLKRAGLDYFHLAEIHRHSCLEELRELHPGGRFFYTSKKAGKLYWEVVYRQDDFLVFGKETEGLPEELLRDNLEFALRIPTLNTVRSLNLSNAVAVVLFEALRQQGFVGESPV